MKAEEWKEREKIEQTMIKKEGENGGRREWWEKKINRAVTGECMVLKTLNAR